MSLAGRACLMALRIGKEARGVELVVERLSRQSRPRSSCLSSSQACP